MAPESREICICCVTVKLESILPETRFIVSPNKKYTALAHLAVLLVLSAARCLVSFLF